MLLYMVYVQQCKVVRTIAGARLEMSGSLLCLLIYDTQFSVVVLRVTTQEVQPPHPRPLSPTGERGVLDDHGSGRELSETAIDQPSNLHSPLLSCSRDHPTVI